MAGAFSGEVGPLRLKTRQTKEPTARASLDGDMDLLVELRRSGRGIGRTVAAAGRISGATVSQEKVETGLSEEHCVPCRHGIEAF